MAFGAMVVPRHVLGGKGFTAPSDRLNIAIVGAGGQGTENAQELLSENIVAVCDVDQGLVARKVAERTKDDKGPREKGLKWQEAYNKATKYTDFREMFAKHRDIDAVLVATPDHAHTPIAKMAMEKGKHVYVQKPLATTVGEVRLLADVAKKTGVVTQMGNQGHSSDSARLINEWVQAGVIGPVREVYIWTNRPIWPQGIPQPDATGGDPNPTSWGRGNINTALAAAMGGAYPTPEGLDWDLYKAAIVSDKPYHPVYHPFNWRGWTDFGVGALGDMGAHLVDHPYWALGLGYPTSIEATSSVWGGPSRAPVTYPIAMTAHYEFPRRGLQPPVKLSWFDGGLMPPRPDVLPDSVDLNREGGVMFIGERGVLMHETYGGNPKLFPEYLMNEAKLVPQTYKRVTTSHEMNWVDAIKSKGVAVSPFDYAARLTETMLLGIVALRTGQGKKILYDPADMKITNVPEANQYLTRAYRPGWGM
jgi:predicted dehydrogenase